MEGKVFPQVPASNVDHSEIQKDERYWYEFPVMMKYLKRKVKGWGIASFFEQMGVNKIALYAITDFTEITADDLKKDGMEVVCICDKNKSKIFSDYCGYPLIGVDELVKKYHSAEIEKILVCSLMHEKYIFRDLMKQGVALEDIISISSAVFS